MPVKKRRARPYRPVDVGVWTDEKFLALSDRGRLLWLYLLTTPAMIQIPGVILAGPATMAEGLGWTLEGFQEGLGELFQEGLVIHVESRWMWLPNAFRYQPEANPNQVTGWRDWWGHIPSGPTKTLLREALKTTCKQKGLAVDALFPNGIGNPSGNHSGKGWGNHSGKGWGNPVPKDQDQDQKEEEALPRARAIPRSTEHQQPELRAAEDQPFAPQPPDTSLPAERLRSPAAEDPAVLARRTERGKIWRELEAAREAVANELGITYRPLPMFDHERELVALFVAIPDVVLAAEHARHAIAVAREEAIGRREYQWLSGVIFGEKQLRRAAGMDPAKMRASRAASSSPRTATSAGRPIRMPARSVEDDDKPPIPSYHTDVANGAKP